MMKMKSAFRALAAAAACAFFYGCTMHKLSPKASDNLDNKSRAKITSFRGVI